MNKNQGLIKTILLIIIAVVILGYFQIDVRGVWNSPMVQNNLNFLSEPANYAWGFFHNYVWLSFIENMQRIKEGSNTTIIENLPQTFEIPATQ